ncbi:hypothetical protein SCA6_001045 [Theobroma cacao]
MAALSTSIAVLLGKLRSVLESEFADKHKKYAAYLQTLYSTLMRISHLIRDAEEIQQDEGLRNVLQTLEDVVYDADDLADEVLYEVTRRKRESESQKLGLWARTFNPSFGERYGKGMQSKIKQILELIDFLSLKTLTFEGMLRWEQWVSLQGEEFPCLQKLNLTNCPNLKGGLPKSLPYLVELRISECQQLADSLPRVPYNCELELSNCDKVRLRSKGGNLSRNDGEEASPFPLSMFEISGHVSFGIPEHSIPSKKVDDSFGFPEYSKPRDEKVDDSFLFPEHSIPSKEPDEVFGFLQYSIPSDERLDDSFLFPEHFIPSKKLDDSFSSSSSVTFKVSSITKLMELPARLPSLKIERCDALESLPAGILDRPLLQRLYIIDCDSLKTFPQLHQPSSLKRLYIHNCRNLEFPQHNEIANQFILLEHLCLGSSCDSLGSFRLDSFPNLKTLSLWDCKKLEYLSMEKGSQNDLKSLEVLEIRDCPNLTTFPEEGLEAPNLTSLVLSNCNNLKSLPQWMQNLTSLQSLHINKCRELQPLPPWRLPSGINILCISFCDKITPQTAWELHKLHSLCNFEIEGGCQDMLSFPEDGLLPTNLNSLRISSLLNDNRLNTLSLAGAHCCLAPKCQGACRL